MISQVRLHSVPENGVQVFEEELNTPQTFEPGLILTPPQPGTLEDDGYVAPGEIAMLGAVCHGWGRVGFLSYKVRTSVVA